MPRKYSSNIVFTQDRLAEEVSYFLEQDAFVFDVETNGRYRKVPTRAPVSWLSMATYGRAVVIPFGHPIGDRILRYDKIPTLTKTNKIINRKTPVWEDPPEQLRLSECAPILEPLFFSEDITKIGQNVPFDLGCMAKYFGGRVPPPPHDDTLLQQWLINENVMPRGLKALVKRYYGVIYDTEDVGKCVEKHPFSKVARYSYMDARYTWLLWLRFGPLVDEEELGTVPELERDLIEVLVGMNQVGAAIDVDHVEKLEERFAARLVELEAEIYRAADQRFNIGSPQQKAKILFAPRSEGGQGLKVHKLTPGGDPSTDKEALEPHQTNKVVKALSQWSTVEKLQSTNIKPWLGHTDDADRPAQILDDDRIHGTFRGPGADTGRLSSSDPNLQNIPTRTAEGKEIRVSFVKDEGRKLLVADYDQIELRILAHYAGPGRLWDAFMEGLDPHSATAAAIYGIPIEDVSIPQRNTGKGSGFAAIYGAQAETVAAQYNVPIKMARHFLKQHPILFPEIYEFKSKVIRVCKGRRPPYVKTLLGRKRRLPGIYARDNKVRSRAERQAVNSIIQGGNADIVKSAMVTFKRKAREIPGLELILTVHDELVALCPEEHVERGAEILRESMVGPHISQLLRVPITTEVKVVDRWSEAK